MINEVDPKKRFEGEVLWVLRNLLYKQESSKKEEPLYLRLVLGSPATETEISCSTQKRVIEKLDEMKAVRILEKRYRVFGKTTFLTFYVEILQPEFNRIYFELQKEESSLRNTENPSLIHSIIFKPTGLDEKTYELIINGRIQSKKTIRKKQGDDSWHTLFNIAKSGFYISETKLKAKRTADYFNFHEKCPLYSKNEYLLTSILDRDDTRLVPHEKIILRVAKMKEWQSLVKELKT